MVGAGLGQWDINWLLANLYGMAQQSLLPLSSAMPAQISLWSLATPSHTTSSRKSWKKSGIARLSTANPLQPQPPRAEPAMPGSPYTRDSLEDNDGHMNMAGNFATQVFSIATVAAATCIPRSSHPETPSPVSSGAGRESQHGTGGTLTDPTGSSTGMLWQPIQL